MTVQYCALWKPYVPAWVFKPHAAEWPKNESIFSSVFKKTQPKLYTDFSQLFNGASENYYVSIREWMGRGGGITILSLFSGGAAEILMSCHAHLLLS